MTFSTSSKWNKKNTLKNRLIGATLSSSIIKMSWILLKRLFLWVCSKCDSLAINILVHTACYFALASNYVEVVLLSFHCIWISAPRSYIFFCILYHAETWGNNCAPWWSLVCLFFLVTIFYFSKSCCYIYLLYYFKKFFFLLQSAPYEILV